MKIKSFIGGYDKNLSYIIWCKNSRKAALIDASTDISPIIKFIQLKKLILEKILITHTHLDHIKYIDNLIYLYPNIQICRHDHPEKIIKGNNRPLKHFEIISIGMEILTILHTPGHYPDSICLWNKKHNYLFTGDTIFVGRTGRTIDQKSNISDLYNSIYNKILKLPDKTIIYPGHHYGHIKYISLKENTKISSFFNCKSEDEFSNVMNKYEQNRKKS